LKKHELIITLGAWVILIALFIGMILSIVSALSYLPQLLTYSTLENTLQQFITDILNIIILLELMALVSLYFSEERVKLEYALDAAAIFIIREVIIYIYTINFSITHLFSLAALLVIIIIARTIAIKYSPDKV